MVRARVHVAAAAFLSISSLFVPLARGADPESEGQRLFREGREALTRSELELACGLFKKSYEVEKAIGPLLNLANCEENRGNIAEARKLWLSASALPSADAEFLKFAEERLAKIEPEVPSLTVQRHSQSPPATRLEIDGVDVPWSSEPLRLNPGRHVIVGRIGSSEKRVPIVLARGDRKTIVLQVDPPVVESTRSEEAWVAGWIVASVGAASGVGFVVTGGIVLDKASKWDAAGCDAHPGLDACVAHRPGDGLYIANGVLGGVAAAGLIAGAVLVLLNLPDSEARAPVALTTGPTELGLGMRLGF